MICIILIENKPSIRIMFNISISESKIYMFIMSRIINFKIKKKMKYFYQFSLGVSVSVYY